MKIVYPNSLAATLDAVNELFFYGRSLLSKLARERVATWIAARQGKPGSYANMFAPTENDFKGGVRLFTGEMLRSRGGTAHILGEEACRALILLDVSSAGVHMALEQANLGMMNRLRQSEVSGYTRGMYCCGTCTCSLWRHLVVGGLGHAERRLKAGMKALKQHRDGKGKWRRFPFYYTLLALSEIDLSSAIEEMRYASRACERFLKHSYRKDKVSQRRRQLVERILEKC